MKKCPYCVEEIQDEAIVCRHCGRKLKGILARRLILAAAIAALVVCVFIYWHQIKMCAYKISLFFKELVNIWNSFREIIKEIPKGLAGLREYHERMESINRMIGR